MDEIRAPEYRSWTSNGYLAWNLPHVRRHDFKAAGRDVPIRPVLLASRYGRYSSGVATSKHSATLSSSWLVTRSCGESARGGPGRKPRLAEAETAGLLPRALPKGERAMHLVLVLAGTRSARRRLLGPVEPDRTMTLRASSCTRN
jgi:hypothetical protein